MNELVYKLFKSFRNKIGDPEIDSLIDRDKITIFLDELMKEYPFLTSIDFQYEMEPYQYSYMGNNSYLPKQSKIKLNITLSE